MAEAEIGVTSCTIGIKGQKKNVKSQVDVWFDSLESVTNVLLKENQRLLKVIAGRLVIELVALTERAVSNVSKTLKMLGKYNLVEIQSTKKMLSSKVIHQEFLVVVNNEK